jgi:hypothetical protein
MVMRKIATLGILLLAGCASTPPPPPPPPPGPGGGEYPPLCIATGGNPSEVRIDVDSTTTPMSLNPKDCKVASGTRIVWREHHNVAFEVDFPDHTPDQGNLKHFTSKSVGSNQEVEFKVKKVWFQHHYGYDVMINGTKLDPAIIVDPH